MQGQYRMYPKRFLVVSLFAVGQMMTAILVNTFTPIAAYLSEIYGQSPVVVNMAGLLFVLMHPLFTFPAAYFIDTYGTRVGIAIGSALCIAGISLRLLINEGFWFAIAGQVVAGIGRPFILNCQAKISSNWFTAETRGGITQLLTLILNVSLVLGIFVPALVFGDYKPDLSDPANLEEGRDLALKVMVVEAVMGYCCYLLNIFFQEALPPTPPSASVTAPRDPFKSALKKLLSNKDYLFLLLSFGCYFGIFNGLSVVLSFLIEPWFGGDELPIAVGAVGGFPIVTGIIGVVVMGPMQRKSGVFKKWVLICMMGSISAMVVFYPLLETGSLMLASLASGYNSFFLIPLVPIMLELGCELAFPVGEGTAVGLLFATGNLFGFFLGLLMSLIVEGESKAQTAGGLAFCFGVFVIGIILAYFMKERLNRKNFERDSDRRKSELSQREGSQLESASNTEKEQELAKPLTDVEGKKPLEENLL